MAVDQQRYAVVAQTKAASERGGEDHFNFACGQEVAIALIVVNGGLSF
jgi:hypothetical protein